MKNARIKNAILPLLIVLLIVSSSGCFGGSAPPTLKEEMTAFQTTLAKYDAAKDLYNRGSYQDAKQEFIAAADQFLACESTFKAIANSDVPQLEKKDADGMGKCSKGFAYAAAYMRDASAEAMKPGSDGGYSIKISADESELNARNGYEAIREELELYWSSK